MDSTGSRGFGGVVHLALHGQGSGDPSGWYTPFGFDLRDGGHDPVLDQLSSIHEIHHAQLTDCTAWGTALHVAFRLGFTSLFDQLLGLCRQIQEMFATVSSVLMLEGEHGDLRQRLAAHYPAYVRFVTSAQALLACVEGPMRAYLMNTQVARVCMQTPILDQMPPATDARIAMPRVIDTPDGRWRWFLHHGQNLVAQASVVADARLRADEAGATALAKDDRIDPSRAVVIEEYDRYWTAWEMAAYSVLADGLAKAGAHVLDFNGHQSQTTRTLEKLALTHSDVGLAAAAPGDTMETAWASAGIVQGRHLVAAAGKWSACWVPDVGEFDWQPMTIAGRPELVIDARLSSRLADLYEWDEDAPDAADWQSITAVRRIDHDSDGGSVIEHWRLSTPERAADLLDAWGDLSTVISCVAASCLTDQDWTRAWLPLLRERTWLVCLIDIELERLVPLWQDHPVRLRRLKAIDATGDRHVLMIQAGAPATDWLVVTNEIGAGLLEDGLEHHPDLCVEVVRDLAQEREREIGVLLTHLLATESFFDLRAWQRYDHPPIGKGMLR